jgi:hypothetical protein
LNKFIEPAGSLKEGVGQVECEGGAIPLLANFEVVEQPTDIGKKQVVDLGLLLEGRLDLGKRVFQVPVLVGKGKRSADLFEARGILPVSQVPIGLQGGRKRKAPRIEARGRGPGQKPCPGALIGCETVSRKVAAVSPFEQIGEEAARIASRGSSFLNSHKHGRDSTTVGRLKRDIVPRLSHQKVARVLDGLAPHLLSKAGMQLL